MLLCSFYVKLFLLHANHSQKSSQPSEELTAEGDMISPGKEVTQPHLHACQLLSGVTCLLSGVSGSPGWRSEILTFRDTDNMQGNSSHKPFHHYFVITAIRKIEAVL